MRFIGAAFFFICFHQSFPQEVVTLGKDGPEVSIGQSKEAALKQIGEMGYSTDEPTEGFVQVRNGRDEPVANLEFRQNVLSNVNCILGVAQHDSTLAFVSQMIDAFRDAQRRGIRQPSISVQHVNQRGTLYDIIMIEYHKGNIMLTKTTHLDGSSSVTLTQQINAPSKGY